jgi:hypothetical protein
MDLKNSLLSVPFETVLLELINTWQFRSFELLNALPNPRLQNMPCMKKNCGQCSKVIHYEIRARAIYTALKFSNNRKGTEFMTI